MDKIWFIKRLDLFKDLPENLMEELEEKSFLEEIKKNTVITIPENKNYVYFIKSGKVVIYKEEDGKRFILDILKENEIFVGFKELENTDEYA
jgi:CRP-like cAMP-binding protein